MRKVIHLIIVIFAAAMCLSPVATEAVAEKKVATVDPTAWNTWLSDLRTEAIKNGISAAILDTALDGLKPIPRVIELDRRQPEFTLTFEEYIKRVVPSSRVARGRLMLSENQALLEKIAKELHVQPRFIVALWGIETDFGRITGGFKVIEALATLAFDGRRAKYFRKQLLSALQILDEGHVTPKKMVGSWAGAMGQPQFMPSSFLAYAIDYDGDGRRDIWGTKPDVFASMANYLSSVGWNDTQTWGREVSLPPKFDSMQINQKKIRPIGDWQRQGVRQIDGSNLPKRQLKAQIVVVGDKDRAFMVYDNFRTTLRWNRSNYFALAVGLLADELSGG